MLQRPHTKIIATLGPATDDPKVLHACLQAGMDIARLNAAHGTKEEKIFRIRTFREAAQKLDRPVGLLVDLPGPKFRLGNLPGGQYDLQRGEFVALGSADNGSQNILPIRDSSILASLEVGHMLHLADGTVTLRVVKRSGASVRCRVDIGGTIRSGSGINVPDTDVKITIPTASDLRWIAFAAAQKADWIGVSFVRTKQDIIHVRRAFSRFRHIPRIIAKIEKPQALTNLDALVQEADGLMVARGDLGVETPLAQVPLAQKRIIARANDRSKPVITATQMLESMVTHRWPTRAEVADVANAVLDGTDAVMLSAETAIGQYPAEAIQMLQSILTATETAYPFRNVLNTRGQAPCSSLEDAISRSSCRLAADTGAKAIVLSSRASVLPHNVSGFRPSMPIIVLTDDSRIYRELALIWGIHPVLTDHRGMESLEPARHWLIKKHLARSGDCAVWIHSVNKTKNDSENSIKLMTL
jgi:pyruvate kinase